MEKGRIIKLSRKSYYVKSNDIVFECHARGKFWNDNITPLVGDFVKFNIIDNSQGYIMEVLPRKNELKRPSISNIDQAIIVMSAIEPEFSTNILDKLLTIIEFNNIKPIICISKVDLINKKEKKELKVYLKYYKKIGYKIFYNKNKFRLKQIIKDKVTVLAGQSGVGKSTLLNKLDKKLNLKTDVISKALGRGKHTTRHVELLEINNGLVADTPGFSALDFIGMTKQDIRNNFIEFIKYNCKYRECNHIEEPECGVKIAVEKGLILRSRYNNYKKFISGM